MICTSGRAGGLLPASALPRWNGGSLALPASAPAERVGSRRGTRKDALADRQSRRTVRERFFAQRTAQDIPPHRRSRIRISAARPCGSVPLLKGAHGISRPVYASLPRSTGCPAPVPSRGDQRARPRR